MLKQENLAANFCGLLAQKGFREPANEFKILGQERDGSILTSWVSKFAPNFEEVSMVGCYNPKEKSFEVLKKFPSRENIIQASVNIKRSLLLFTTKNPIITENTETDPVKTKYAYRPCLSEIGEDRDQVINLLDIDKTKQVMLQFLWPKQPKDPEVDKFLLMIHEEGIHLNTVRDLITEKSELIVKNSFIWSQWEPKIQALYYIHLKQSTRISLEKEEDDIILSPTLSAFQFHDDLPTETVLNIPLNLPKIPAASQAEYDDNPVPLRIHDSSLNLIMVSDDEKGTLFICHHYLYQPMLQEGVHYAISVTMVHCSHAIHLIIPDVPWEKAKLMKPTFAILDEHLLVYQPGLFASLFDMGLHHEPCGHISSQPFMRQSNVTHLVPCFGTIAYDSATLDLVSLQIQKSHLIDTFRNDSTIDNRLSIIHYFLAHCNELEVFPELLSIIMEQPLHLDTVTMLKEALVAGTYSSLKKGLSQDALSLIKLLPLTTCNINKSSEWVTSAKVGEFTVGLSFENLHNTAMMLLSPQQRLNPYRQDTWTRLYDRLNDNKDSKQRFCCDQVTEKLVYSLAAYQPETLSRCSTPQTPSGSAQIGIGDFASISCNRTSNDLLPFTEFETCTASRQEHVISVNLRELSMHLVKNSVKQMTGFRWLKDYEPAAAPTFVHAVSTRYVSAQLEVSRLLCVYVCRAAGVDARFESERGFALIDKLAMPQRYLLFLMLERYVSAVCGLSFPLPQGFSSFFTYLGYRALNFEEFLEYSQRFVFELQIDVMKAIMSDIPDTPEGIKRKTDLLLLLPRSRARRLLNNWDHPVSLRIRGNEHAANVLSGNSSGRSMSLSSGSQSSSQGPRGGNRKDDRECAIL